MDVQNLAVLPRTVFITPLLLEFNIVLLFILCKNYFIILTYQTVNGMIVEP